MPFISRTRSLRNAPKLSGHIVCRYRATDKHAAHTKVRERAFMPPTDLTHDCLKTDITL